MCGLWTENPICALTFQCEDTVAPIVDGSITSGPVGQVFIIM